MMELMPCPFCGNADVQFHDPMDQDCGVLCKACDSYFGLSTKCNYGICDEAKKEIIDKFNRRAPEDCTRNATLEEVAARLMNEMKEDGAIEWKWAAGVARSMKTKEGS
jgi:hypothetical protein